MKHPTASRSQSRDRIAYENWLYQVDLWRVPLAGGPPSVIAPTTDEWSFQPDVSPDGSRVAFVSTRSGEQDIWVARTSGEDARRVTSLTNARVETPRWSPDGSRLVFSSRERGRADVWILDAAGGFPRRLTAGRSDAVAPSWSRDGRSVYFGARPDAGGPWQVWKARVSDGRTEPATEPGGYAAKESPDGRFLYFTRAEERGIWRRPLVSDAAADAPASWGAERVVEDFAPEDWADWDVGSRGVYFKTTAMEADHRGAAVAFLAHGAPRAVELARLPDAGWSGFSVSGDGAFVIYSRVDRHACDIRIIDNPTE